MLLVSASLLTFLCKFVPPCNYAGGLSWSTQVYWQESPLPGINYSNFLNEKLWWQKDIFFNDSMYACMIVSAVSVKISELNAEQTKDSARFSIKKVISKYSLLPEIF